MSEITYTVTIKGPVPPDLAEKVIKAHAAAIASRLELNKPSGTNGQ